MLPKDQRSSSSAEEQRTATAPEASTTYEELLGLGAPTSWKAAASASAPSSALTYWKLDEHPTPQDGQRRALDWVGTARAVAARVTREEVDRAVAR